MTYIFNCTSDVSTTGTQVRRVGSLWKQELTLRYFRPGVGIPLDRCCTVCPMVHVRVRLHVFCLHLLSFICVGIQIIIYGSFNISRSVSCSRICRLLFSHRRVLVSLSLSFPFLYIRVTDRAYFVGRGLVLSFRIFTTLDMSWGHPTHTQNSFIVTVSVVDPLKHSTFYSHDFPLWIFPGGCSVPAARFSPSSHVSPGDGVVSAYFLACALASPVLISNFTVVDCFLTDSAWEIKSSIIGTVGAWRNDLH